MDARGGDARGAIPGDQGTVPDLSGEFRIWILGTFLPHAVPSRAQALEEYSHVQAGRSRVPRLTRRAWPPACNWTLVRTLLYIICKEAPDWVPGRDSISRRSKGEKGGILDSFRTIKFDDWLRVFMQVSAFHIEMPLAVTNLVLCLSIASISPGGAGTRRRKTYSNISYFPTRSRSERTWTPFAVLSSVRYDPVHRMLLL